MISGNEEDFGQMYEGGFGENNANEAEQKMEEILEVEEESQEEKIECGWKGKK